MKVHNILEEIGFVFSVLYDDNSNDYSTIYIYKNYKVIFYFESNDYDIKQLIDSEYSYMDLYSELKNDYRNEVVKFLDLNKNDTIEFLKEEFKHILRKGKIKKLLSL